VCLLLLVEAWLNFLFRKLIINASVGGVFKDFLKNGFPLTNGFVHERASRRYVKVESSFFAKTKMVVM